MGSDLLEVYLVLAALSMVIRDAARLALVTWLRGGEWGAQACWARGLDGSREVETLSR